MQGKYRKAFLGIMAILSAAAITGCGTRSIKDSDVVMEIAGQPVVKAEYQMVLQGYVAEVKSQYSTEEANAEDFWDMDQDGKEPLAQIMELAKDDLIHKKAVAQLAKAAGIAGETDYMSIAGKLETENADRGNKAASGEVVYGLTSFQQQDYYSYVYTNLEAQLLESLKASHPISDQELEQIYQEDQERYTSDISVRMLVGEMPSEAAMSHEPLPQTEPGQEESPEAGTSQGTPQGQSLKDRTELAQQVKLSMEEGKDIEALTEQYPEINFYELKLSSLNTQEGKSGVYAQRWIAASTMEQGEVCEPFFIGENIMVMRCLDRAEKVKEPFEDVKGVLKSEVQTSLAQEDIEKAIQEAEINVQEEILKQAAKEALIPE